jgi:hypothetical protein
MIKISKPFDMNKVHTIVYHLPDGEILAIDKDTIEAGVNFGCGDVCDTSEINGEVHFFPKGNA